MIDSPSVMPEAAVSRLINRMHFPFATDELLGPEARRQTASPGL
jgi:hypothetical protein